MVGHSCIEVSPVATGVTQNVKPAWEAAISNLPLYYTRLLAISRGKDIVMNEYFIGSKCSILAFRALNVSVKTSLGDPKI